MRATVAIPPTCIAPNQPAHDMRAVNPRYANTNGMSPDMRAYRVVAPTPTPPDATHVPDSAQGAAYHSSRIDNAGNREIANVRN